MAAAAAAEADMVEVAPAMVAAVVDTAAALEAEATVVVAASTVAAVGGVAAIATVTGSVGNAAGREMFMVRRPQGAGAVLVLWPRGLVAQR